MTERRPPDADVPHQPLAPDLSWFLRRELLTIPLLIVVAGTLIVFGVSPATLLFVALFAIAALSIIWSGAPRRSE